jgi:glycine/D-amino acid oxidase-like deaminating enzyme
MGSTYSEEMAIIMNYDYAIIGAGIQGLVLLDRMRALGLNVCGIDPDPQADGRQADRAPFHVHRGHGVAERERMEQLHDAYPHWQNIVRRLGVRIRSTESYVGFAGDSRRWTDAWDALDLPYAQTAAKSGLLAGHRLQAVFTFPHMLFDGRELFAKLRQANREHLLAGAIRHVSPCWQGYRLFVGDRLLTAKKLIVCAGAGTADVLNAIPDLTTRVEVQTRVCQVLTMRGAIANASIVVPDAQMSITPQYAADGSAVLLYTHGTRPIRTEKNHRIDIARLEKQLDALRATLPGLSEAGRVRGIYTTLETESLPSGALSRHAFVERVADDVLCVLPARPSFAMNASDQVLSLLNSHRSYAPAPAHAARPPYLAPSHPHQEIQGVHHA